MLILASNSPRRRQLLQLGGWEFSILSVEVDESPRAGENPAAYVSRLAESKARAAALHLPAETTYLPETVILAADTTVVDGQEILSKPADAAEAAAMLARLRGRTHQVITAQAALRTRDGELIQDLCITTVTMRAYTDDEMDAYIASGDPLDKAGAYAIQHLGFYPVQSLQGCYANVVGLPLCQAMRLLARLGLQPAQPPLLACLFTDTQGVCSISTSFLDASS